MLSVPAGEAYALNVFMNLFPTGIIHMLVNVMYFLFVLWTFLLTLVSNFIFAVFSSSFSWLVFSLHLFMSNLTAKQGKPVSKCGQFVDVLFLQSNGIGKKSWNVCLKSFSSKTPLMILQWCRSTFVGMLWNMERPFTATDAVGHARWRLTLLYEAPLLACLLSCELNLLEQSIQVHFWLVGRSRCESALCSVQGWLLEARGYTELRKPSRSPSHTQPFPQGSAPSAARPWLCSPASASPLVVLQGSGESRAHRAGNHVERWPQTVRSESSGWNFRIGKHEQLGQEEHNGTAVMRERTQETHRWKWAGRGAVE